MSERYFFEQGVCPDCQGPVAPHDVSCSNCGKAVPVDIEIGARTGGLYSSLRGVGSESIQKMLVIVGCVFFVAVALVVLIWPSDNAYRQKENPEAPQIAAAEGAGAERGEVRESPRFVGAGKQGRLKAVGNALIWTAMSSGELDQLHEAARLERYDVQSDLIKSGRFRAASEGVRVLVRERQWFGNVEVEVLEGPMTGKVVWVHSDNVGAP